MDLLGDKILDDLVEQMEEDDEAELMLVLHIFNENKKTRLFKWRNRRLNWDEHVERERHTGSFSSKYHMSEECFNKLVDLLRPWVTVDYQKSINSTSGNTPIFPELVVATGLRFLGGEVWKSLEDIFGIDILSCKRITRKFLLAVDEHPNLEINLPNAHNRDELDALSNGFASISSSQGLFIGAIGAIDGWLCCTGSPMDRDITNKRSYYSGHYSRFGLNIQAICDSRLRFIYFAVAAPGGTNDARALRRCLHLQSWLDKIKGMGYFLVGDNAYVLSDELLIPYSGRSLSNNQRTYNFFLSQLRIRIELAFGRLATKWRIFRRNLEYSMAFNSLICVAAAKLHNYVINQHANEEGDEQPEIIAMTEAPNGLGYLPHNPTYFEEPLVLDREQNETPEPPGQSPRRQHFVHFISINGMGQPDHNVERNG